MKMPSRLRPGLLLNQWLDLCYSNELYGTTFNTYLKKPGVTNAKKLFSLSAVEGLLSAYRLFYVGCSRARSELDVVIPFAEVSDVDATAEKLRQLGFEVCEDDGS